MTDLKDRLAAIRERAEEAGRTKGLHTPLVNRADALALLATVEQIHSKTQIGTESEYVFSDWINQVLDEHLGGDE